jgi:cytochrome c-type biogenesis protein
VDAGSLGIVTVFAAGVVSFLSPCVLPLVPGYLSYIAGSAVGPVELAAHRAVPGARLQLVGLSLCFVLGFSAVFVALGASATWLGQKLLAYRYETNIIGGSIIIVFGLLMTGLVRISWMQRDLRFHGAIGRQGPLGATALGIAFGFGWTPCIGPVLGAILTLSAVSPAISNGTALLAIYALGLGLPFVLAAAFASVFVTRMRHLRRLGRPLQIVAGALMILMGVAMITGWLSTFAFWMLNTFPVFGRIG